MVMISTGSSRGSARNCDAISPPNVHETISKCVGGSDSNSSRDCTGILDGG